jgi:hypothetical protein
MTRRLSKLGLASAALLLWGCTRTLIVDDRSTAGAGNSAGEGGSGNSAGEGGAGSEDPPVATARWTGNDPSCPEAVWHSSTTCEPGVEEGTVCAFYKNEEDPTQTPYTECACRLSCDSGGPLLRWDCYRNIDADFAQCPAEQPEAGSACDGAKGVDCYYPPYVKCACPSGPNDASWDCVTDAPPQPEAPSSVELSKRIVDLTPEDRATLCAWYAPAAERGFTEAPVFADGDGFSPDTGCAFATAVNCSTLTPVTLPTWACEANLALSACQATVADLNDCYLTARSGYPSPRGCARFLSEPECAGTLVVHAASAEAVAGPPELEGPPELDCRVRIE